MSTDVNDPEASSTESVTLADSHSSDEDTVCPALLLVLLLQRNRTSVNY